MWHCDVMISAGHHACSHRRLRTEGQSVLSGREGISRGLGLELGVEVVMDDGFSK